MSEWAWLCFTKTLLLACCHLCYTPLSFRLKNWTKISLFGLLVKMSRYYRKFLLLALTIAVLLNHKESIIITFKILISFSSLFYNRPYSIKKENWKPLERLYFVSDIICEGMLNASILHSGGVVDHEKTMRRLPSLLWYTHSWKAIPFLLFGSTETSHITSQSRWETNWLQ